MAKLVFNGDFNGTYQVRNQKLVLDKEDGLRPYDLTYGAIAGCLYSTFLNILELNDLNVDETEIVINGRKRTTIPTTVEYINIHFFVKTSDNKKKISDCFYESLDACSMIVTFRHVAEIESNISFEL